MNHGVIGALAVQIVEQVIKLESDHVKSMQPHVHLYSKVNRVLLRLLASRQLQVCYFITSQSPIDNNYSFVAQKSASVQ